MEDTQAFVLFFRAVATLIVGFLIGSEMAVPTIQRIKTKLNLTGWKVLALLLIFSVAITVVAAVAEGVLFPNNQVEYDWTALITYIIVSSQIRYGILQRQVLEAEIENGLTEPSAPNITPFRE